jgi:ketosteroid isomerase-like protein
MTHEDISPLDRLLIIKECESLIVRFAERNDARDADALAQMFVEDGSFARPTAPDRPIRGREAIREQFRARPANKMTRHICANTVVEVVDRTEATAVSYILLFTATLEDGATLPVKADARKLLGAYRDLIVRDTDGIWKFRERVGSLAMSIED